MTDPRKPTLSARMRAAAAGERSAAPLEALRTAGKAAYDEQLQADRLRDELTVAEIPLWTAPVGVGSQLLAAWNAFALQTLGEALLDADYAADDRTAGFVPPATYEHAFACLSAVPTWIDRARRARVDPDYDVAAEVDLPARAPGWVAAAGHAGALVLAASSLRGPADLALHDLGRTPAPAGAGAAVSGLRRSVSQAATAAEYAASLHGSGADPALAGVIQQNIAQAVMLWFEAGQFAAMPRLLTAAGVRRPGTAHPGPAVPTPAAAPEPVDPEPVDPEPVTPDRSALSLVAPPLDVAARLDLAAALVRAAGRAGAGGRIDPIVSAKHPGIGVQVPSGNDARDRLDVLTAYARVLGVQIVREPTADGTGSWYKAVGTYRGCMVDAWALIAADELPDQAPT